MPFTLIRGTYHVRGYQPDGDSVRFGPLDDTHWRRLRGRVALNARGHAQLRLEAIDTLETHFLGQHQPLGLATKALDFLLHELGIAQITWAFVELRRLAGANADVIRRLDALEARYDGQFLQAFSVRRGDRTIPRAAPSTGRSVSRDARATMRQAVPPSTAAA